ncbi:hypothetical protein K8I61_17150 [bacterium]|nr:hypothetical protein [bacterium]
MRDNIFDPVGPAEATETTAISPDGHRRFVRTAGEIVLFDHRTGKEIWRNGNPGAAIFGFYGQDVVAIIPGADGTTERVYRLGPNGEVPDVYWEDAYWDDEF